MDELDRILSEEHAISPPLGFSRRVMAIVEQEASSPAPIPFPLRQAVATMVAIVIASIACWFFSLSLPSWAAVAVASVERTFAGIDPTLLAWCTSAVFAAVALVRYSVRFITA